MPVPRLALFVLLATTWILSLDRNISLWLMNVCTNLTENCDLKHADESHESEAKALGAVLRSPA
jgi:hypothetical protein